MEQKTIIRWAGSKRKMLPVLKENAPKTYKRYIEPFCGSACLFFELKPREALLSDINDDLINALKKLRHRSNIREKLLEFPDDENTYYKIRNQRPENLSSYDRAIRFLYLNRYCFNGVYRTNKKGIFNVPRGNRTGDFPSKDTFDEAKRTLKNAQLETMDYKKCLMMAKRDDFVYLDPPYAKSDKFTGEYGVGSFNGIEIPILIKELINLDKKGVKFLFSYRECDLVRNLVPSNFLVLPVTVNRHIAGFKTKWMIAKEILVKNYE